MGVEAQQANDVETGVTKQLDLSPRPQQASRRIIAAKILARQWLETQQCGVEALLAGTGKRAADQRTVAQMQTVESANTDHAAPGTDRLPFDVSKQPAHWREL